MRTKTFTAFVGMIAVVCAANSYATNRYVSLVGAHVSPFTNWVEAATNIQDAVDVCIAGDVVTVSNGEYNLGGRVTPGAQVTNRVAIADAIEVRSANGPSSTSIDGATFNETNGIRCAYLTNGASLIGFTLQYGHTMIGSESNWPYNQNGGGAFLDRGGVVSNCIISYNNAQWGGGVYCNSGGVVHTCNIGNNGAGNSGGAHLDGGGEIRQATIVENTAANFVGGVTCDGGLVENAQICSNQCQGEDIGGAVCSAGGVLRNCYISWNLSTIGAEFSDAGGVSVENGGTAEWCIITYNQCRQKGGGAWVSEGGFLGNCTIVCNTAGQGGGILCEEGGVVNNCACGQNFANQGGGIFCNGVAVNCSLLGNIAEWQGGGAWCGQDGTLRNSIMYYNFASVGSNYYAVNGSGLVYCCATPLAAGVGNTSDEPCLVGFINEHIASNSPCIDAGNVAYVIGSNDCDYEARTHGGLVDIGCDEYYEAGITGLLTADIQVDRTNVVAGFPVTFTSLVVGKASRIEWNIGGETVNDLIMVTKSWSTPGPRQAILIAYNGTHPDGVSATTSVTVADLFTNYVALTATPLSPYTTWASAANTIQDAASVCPAGSVVIVSNGVYSESGSFLDGLSNRVALTAPVKVCSLNGRVHTLIQGDENTRCAFVGQGATLSGFCLSNGTAAAGGADPYYTDCGGGVLVEGGCVHDCLIINNSSDWLGGGAYCRHAGVISNCTVTGNNAGEGGGIYCGSGVQAENCQVVNNYAYYGGGIGCYYGVTLNRCSVLNNQVAETGPSDGIGGGIMCRNGSMICNSLIIGNSAAKVGGGVFSGSDNIPEYTEIDNCTICNNEATYEEGDGVEFGLSFGVTTVWTLVRNSIMYDNAHENYNDVADDVISYSCTTPDPGGVANITNDPEFVEAESNNFHLQLTSPCINTGNVSYAFGEYDLDGNDRIIDGKIDLGCYETIPEPLYCIGISVLVLLALRSRKV